MIQFTTQMNLRMQNRTNEGHIDMDQFSMTRFSNREQLRRISFEGEDVKCRRSDYVDYVYL